MPGIEITIPYVIHGAIQMSRRTKISGALLRTLRMEAGFTQEELASKVGLSRETVSAIENEKPGTIDTIEAEVISMWYIVCRQKASAQTENQFFGHVMKYFGFSEKLLLNMANFLSSSDKRD